MTRFPDVRHGDLIVDRHISGEVVLRDSDGHQITRTCSMDSMSTPFDFGLLNHGCFSLALNILNHLVPPRSDGFGSQAMPHGECSLFANQHFTKFARQFLGPGCIPDEGGVLPAEALEEFLKENGQLHGLELTRSIA